MSRTPHWRSPGPSLVAWPPDRFEVRCTFPPPTYNVVDRYHFAEFAYEAAVSHREIGLAHQVQVIRLSDGGVLFDLLAAHETPLAAW
jgi:hypothetical protein